MVSKRVLFDFVDFFNLFFVVVLRDTVSDKFDMIRLFSMVNKMTLIFGAVVFGTIVIGIIIFATYFTAFTIKKIEDQKAAEKEENK